MFTAYLKVNKCDASPNTDVLKKPHRSPFRQCFSHIAQDSFTPHIVGNRRNPFQQV